MRILALVALLLLTTPAAAQYAPPLADHGPATGHAAPALPPQMMDPALPGQLARMAGALTHAFMNLPVGEMQAAVEGRPVTPQDRRRTVGSETAGNNPYVAQDIQRDVANQTVMVQNMARGMQRAMPAVQQALGQAAAAIERETANLPNPNYPRR